MAFRKLVGSYKDYNLATHVIEDGYLAVDVDTGSLRIGDGSTPGGTVIASAGGGGGGGGGAASSLGDLSAVGSTLSAPTNADLTLAVAGSGNIVLTGITFPNSDGSNTQVLATNGSGILSFVDPVSTNNIDGGTAASVFDSSLTTIDGGTAA
tara:strand:+ start:351 stop:806 length:456 start_codon:yes stop_codon:yes gene_type:complete